VTGVRRLALAAAAVSLVLGACSPGTGHRMSIQIHHSQFSAETIEAKVGDIFTFEIVNGDPIAHEFILGDEAVQARHESGTERKHGAKPGEVSVPAGTTARTTYTFTEPGTLVFACHLPGHFAYGMHGEVHVSA
jgi:uncharacterized cupredoxin-like copper-binding protein